MATGDLFDPGGVISADPGGTAAGQGAATSTSPKGTTTIAIGIGASTGPASAAASVGTFDALASTVWLHLEVSVGSSEQGDRNSHIGSTCC